jgi:hypothetical protein
VPAPTVPRARNVGVTAPATNAPSTIAPVVVRRLNRVEYDNTVRDLLGDRSRPAAAFPPDETAFGFDNQGAALTVPPLLAERLVASAEVLSRSAMAQLPSLLPCAAAADEPCARRFVTDLGQRAFRRPLAADEVTRFMQVFLSAWAHGDFKSGAEVVLRSMLVSPFFLYRVELGAPALTPWEVASRLSYFLWQSMPDEILFTAARVGALGSDAEVAAQAERMLADPRAAAAIGRFHTQWLRLQALEAGTLQKDGKVFPKWKSELGPLLHREVTVLLNELVGQGPRGFAGIFTAEHTHLDATLAAHYGVKGPSGDGFAKVALDGRYRAGLLARGGVMAALAHHNQSSPTLRGRFVREHLLCQALPPPPADVDNVPSAPSASRTTRERLSQHARDPSCAGCHAAIDPIGLALENFDGAGQYRTQESGKPIDAGGELDGPFVGAPGLGAKLAASDQAAACLATQWLRFALGRGEESGDAPVIAQLAGQLGRDGDVRALLLALVQTPQFRLRGSP